MARKIVQPQFSKVLVVAAHPDDEVLGCGGTAARLSAEGAEVRFLILGEGITSRQTTRSRRSAKNALAALGRDAAKAADIVGARGVEILSFPDNRFDEVALLELVKAVESRIQRFEPTAVFTHHYGDLNIDHQLTCRAVMIACRPVAGATVRHVYAFEVPSSTEWSPPQLGGAFEPTCYVSLSAEQLHRKIKAMECYGSEARKAPHPRAPESLRALAVWRGANAGLPFAEAFEVMRTVF